ncbi:MAG: T9SS type A sorting domain-containing protein [Bacteroidales bacterium]|nr:T9SS type A sorting domain-containing protein [Bacteroidales bacterium]
MRKTSLLTALFLLFSFMGFAQEWHGITSDSPKAMKKTLVSSTENEIVVEVNLDGFYTQNVTTPNGKQVMVSVDKMATELEAGAPQLPYDVVSVIIGDMAEMKVAVVNSNYVDYENVEVAPSKGNFSRQINPEDVDYTYGAMYQQDAFWPATQATLDAPYIMRDFRGQNILVRPFAYNPVTKTLRVYTNMTIVMTKVSDNGENQKVARRSNTIKVDPEQKAQYDRRFINFGETSARYTFDEDFGEMLIICTDAYMSNLQPLVEWKNKSGRPTTLVSLTTAGGNNIENIKSYVSSFYNDPSHNLEFLLLVGEFNDITPKNYGSGAGGTCYSDNYLGKLEGNDDYLEVLVGRFSVANAADADLQVSKTIYYERDIQAGAAWVNKGMGIGYYGAGSGHYGEDDYQHIDFIRDTLMHYTYAQVTEHHGGSGGDASVATISGTTNQGISIINYCNHGNWDSWGVANYSVSNVSALTNDGMLPVVWSVACLNGEFDHPTCFAESWLRAKNNATGAPTGAVAGMFSYVSQPWVPPMYGQDEMVDILTGWHSADQFNHTIGGASLNGSMYVRDMAPGDSYQTFNTWLLFGDPSSLIRTDIPTAMNVTASPSVLMLGMTELELTVDADYAIATLSMDGEIIASQRVINGQCTMQFPALSNVGDAELVIVGYNKETYMGSIEVVPAEGAYLTVNGYEMNVPQANYGETVDMSVNFKNVGVEVANNITATLSTESEYIDITSAEGTIATINPDQVLTVDGFQFTVANDVPDETIEQIDVTITDGTNVWTGKMMVQLHAPVLQVESLTINDSDVEFTFANVGTAPFYGATLNLTSCSPDLVFSPESMTVDEVVGGGETLSMLSNYSVAATVEPGTTFEVAYTFSTGLFEIQDIFVLSYGTIMENFESGSFSSDWTFSTNNAWIIVDGGTKGTKCAKSTNEGIGNSDYSATLTVDVLAAGDLTFMYKVSSENNYDFLRFYMDNQKKAEWCGTSMTGFEQYTQAVTAGQHTFKWEYHKDSSVNSGSDCAWIDDIIFPPTNVFTFLAPATDLVAAVDGANVNLTWTASADADKYIVKRDGEVVGETTQTTFGDVLPHDGIYMYAVFAAKNNGQMSTPVNVTIEASFDGVEEAQEVMVNVYPNPAHEVMYIVTNGNVEYQMINSVGQVVMSGNVEGSAQINVSGLNSGVYFLKVDANIQKIVIK